MRRRPVIASELRRFVEAITRTSYTPRRDDVRAFAEFVRAAGRAAWEETSALLRTSRTNGLDPDDPEVQDLRSVQAAFSSAIYGMATSNAALRDRVASAMADLVPFMSQRHVPDETTAVTWQALMMPLWSRPLDEALAALPEAEMERVATAICKIDARLRWLIR
jgi:hypothetical protein